MSTSPITNLGFELAYLSLLTKEGLKPLSRWEKNFTPGTEEALRSLGLETRVVERSVQSGKRLRELVFSPSDECLAEYADRFDRTAIRRDPASMRIEGRLFGYPSCCVEGFVARGYAKNALRRSDQRILNGAAIRRPVSRSEFGSARYSSLWNRTSAEEKAASDSS